MDHVPMIVSTQQEAITVTVLLDMFFYLTIVIAKASKTLL